MLNEPATRSPWSWLQVMEGETLIQSLTRLWLGFPRRTIMLSGGLQSLRALEGGGAGYDDSE
jgi:ABC-type sugar transport system permease subunit